MTVYKTLLIPAPPTMAQPADRDLIEDTVRRTAGQLGWNLTHILVSQYDGLEERWELTVELTRQEH